MKTKDEMKIVPSFDELVFENRNMEYGAYKIRKKYNAALIWSILVSVLFVSATVITPFVIEKGTPIVVKSVKESTPVVYTATPIDIPDVQQSTAEPPTVRIPKYVAPVVVDSFLLEKPNELATNEELSRMVKNDSITIDSNPSPTIEIEPFDKDKIVEFYDLSEKPFFGTEGDNEFRRWIAQNIKYPEAPLAAGIQGRVYVQFVVERDGSLTNIVAVRSVDSDLSNEAVRVVALSPKWNPGKQQGKPVRVSYTFPITFSIK